MLLENKVCIVAGAASLRGIGYAIAQLFAEHGAKLAVIDLAMNEDVAEEIRSSIQQATQGDVDLIGLKCDISNADDCERVVAEVVSRFGTASVAAQRGGGLVGGAHYAASKGGVISLTRTVAREFGPQGIRANVVCPSMTETGMLDGNVTAEKFQEIVEAIPLKRAGKARDVAGACLFLASDLSAYVTGATLDVNGGSHIH